jgi:N,N'-diacetyllegionaminate synthase
MANPFFGKHGPLLIAEIGGNHEGDFNYAVELTRQAIEADVDIIKYQIYTGATLVNKKESPDRYKHFQKFELSQEKHIQLANLCIENNIQYSASVWDESVLDWIDPFLKIYKIGSGDLTTYPLLKSISKRGKPIILSTGLSSLDEIFYAVDYIQNQNSLYKSPDQLAILQCTSLYPNQDEDANLNVIQTLKKSFSYPIGYSDHTTGALALRVAYALGAQILEFHFTDTREGKEFRDHHIALTKREVQELIKDIQTIGILKGSEKKAPTPREISTDHIHTFRRAVYPVMDLKAGTIITENHLVVLRPNHGIDARDINNLLGRKVKSDISELSTLTWDMFESEK